MTPKCIPLLFIALAWTASATAGKNNWFDLHNAARMGNLTNIEYLATIKSFCVDARDPDGWTALHVAAWYNQADIVELLLEYDADVNAQTKLNWTPLHCAALQGSKNCVRSLVANGADVLARTKRENTPLSLALEKDCTSIIAYLKPFVIYSNFNPKSTNQN